jgi:hypothetical protein
MTPAGRPTLRSRSQLAGQEVMAVTLTLIVLAIGVLVIGHVVRRVLDRLRMARWEVDWSAVEPQRTGRRRQH